jgi:hypothetical protein
MKNKIVALFRKEKKTLARLFLDKNEKKNKGLERFKQDLVQELKCDCITNTPYELSEVYCKGLDINIVKSKNYTHLIIYGSEKKIEKALKILFRYFDFYEAKIKK